MPWMVVFQFWLAATTWSRVLTAAAVYCASGTRSRMASTSSAFRLRRLARSHANAAPARVAVADGIMFVPAAWIRVSISCCAPWPRATIVMTAATPMIIPSIVRLVRIWLRPSALSAIRKTMSTDIF